MFAWNSNSQHIEYFENSHKHGFIKIIIIDLLLLIIGYKFQDDEIIWMETFFYHYG